MKNKKVILVILICLVIISLGVVGAFYLINEENGMAPARERGEITLEREGDEVLLTEEQYQLVKDSITQRQFERMSDIERKSTWLLLNAMSEIDFVENAQPGESLAATAVIILGVLGVEAIEEITIIEVAENVHFVDRTFMARIISDNNEIYYILYDPTWGLQMVIKDSEDGEIIFSRLTHIIIDGEVHERVHGGIISEEEVVTTSNQSKFIIAILVFIVVIAIWFFIQRR